MDLNQDNPETVATPENKPGIKLPEIKIPELGFMKKSYSVGLTTRLKHKIKEYVRVYKITKKPDKAEFESVVKASGLGITIIGVIGFIISILAQLIT